MKRLNFLPSGLTPLLNMCLMLMLALSPAQSWAEEEYWEYTFRPGDSIWKIAREHTNSVDNWSALQRINRIGKDSERQIMPGSRIKIPVSMLKQQPQPALVVSIHGIPQLKRANGELEPVTVDGKLYAGDRVITGAGQSVKLQFADKSELQIQANSEVILDKLSYHKKTGMVDTRIRLQQGNVYNWVEKLKPESRYQIQTPAAITAVRGTAYRLISDADGLSRTEVTEGVVGVSADGIERSVESGFGLVMQIGKPLPLPVKLLSAPQLDIHRPDRQGKVTLSWQPLPGAVRYRYQLATDAEFNRIIIDRSTVQSELELETLPAGHYYLRISAIDDLQLQGLSSMGSFEIAQVMHTDTTINDVIIPSGILILGQ